MDDPTKISEKQQKKVKQFCKEYFDKAVIKHRAHAKKNTERHSKEPDVKLEDGPNVDSDEAVDVKMSDDEEDGCEDKSTVMEVGEPGGSLKRKRDEADKENGESTAAPLKRQRSFSPPPPPPPMTPGDGEEGEQGMEDNSPGIKPEDDELVDSKRPLETPPPPPPPPEDDQIQMETEGGEALPPKHSPGLKENIQPKVEGKT